MRDKEELFLTRQDALAAIQADFVQYGPQHRLLRKLSPLILDRRCRVIDEGPQAGVWIKRGRSGKLRRIKDAALGEHLCHALRTDPPPLPVLAEICRRVFQVPATTGQPDGPHGEGIWLDTDMTGFSCRQCGWCCRNLTYHNDCTAGDYARWQALGRSDIMERVKIVRCGGKPAAYHIWMDPATGRLSPVCPWLEKDPAENRHLCGIHAVKPEICRQYPGTRKHAVKTGCRAFIKESRVASGES